MRPLLGTNRARRSLTGLIACLALVALATPAWSGTLTIPVGREATWLHLPSGEKRVDGRRVASVEISRRRIARRCLDHDADFNGYARLSRIRGPRGEWLVRVDCLGDPEKPDSSAVR